MMKPCDSILVVRPGALGDTILSLPFVQSLMKKFPGAKITFLGNPSYKPLFQGQTAYDSIDDPKWTWMFMPTGSELQNASGFQSAYVYLKNPDLPVKNLVSAGAGQVVSASSHLPDGVHIVEHMHREFGFDVPQKGPALSSLAGRRKGILWIHPGSGGKGKCLPLRFMMEYAGEVAERCNLRKMVTIGEADAFLKDDPYRAALSSDDDVVMIEDRTVPELCDILGGAALYIGYDSGISHLAAALGIKSIVFFVASDPRQWAPWVPESLLHVEDVRINQSVSLKGLSIPKDFVNDLRP